MLPPSAFAILHAKSINPRSKIADRAFTLIELLTVIAIIGILAAIIIPTVASVRKTARATKCLSNMRQTGAAFLLYLSEHKDCFPTQETAKATYDNDSSWSGQIYPYLNTWETMRCSENTDIQNKGYKNPISFLYNKHVAQNLKNFNANPRGTPTRLSQSISPSQDMIMFDQRPAQDGVALIEAYYAATDSWWYPHKGERRSTLYVDGHVGWTTRTSVSERQWHWTRQ